MENFVAFNNCDGEFSLSPLAVRWLADRGVEKAWELIDSLGLSIHIITIDEAMLGLKRHSPLLILCIEELGKEASGECSSIEIVKINSKRYVVRSTNGIETVLTPETMNWNIID